MNAKPLNQTDRLLISELQAQLDELRQRLKINAPGAVLFRADVSYGDKEVIWVEANGFGGAVMRVVDGNYPTDFFTREEQNFSTETEAMRAAEAFYALAT